MSATTGLGKALKPITHPLRADIPILLGAEGPKNVALAAEICDGWLPIFYTPRLADMYNEWLDEGFARPGARRTREDLRDLRDGQHRHHRGPRRGVRRYQAVYRAVHGRHGRRGHQLPRRRLPRMGYADVVDEVTALFRSGPRKDEERPRRSSRTR